MDVGKNILQFEYQLKWVEQNRPWNFDNNLLLLCRWRRGLSVTNIKFTHSPFCVQICGLPFELVSKEVGSELGNSIGRFIEMDRQARQSEQAKFMRIRVDLQLDKPLRRGGRVASVEGEKCWESFRYERLPVFCFQCGKLRHDERHFLEPPDQQNPRQYDCLQLNFLLVQSPMVVRITPAMQVTRKIQMKGVQDSMTSVRVTVLKMLHVILQFRRDRMLQGIQCHVRWGFSLQLTPHLTWEKLRALKMRFL